MRSLLAQFEFWSGPRTVTCGIRSAPACERTRMRRMLGASEWPTRGPEFKPPKRGHQPPGHFRAFRGSVRRSSAALL